MSLYLLGDQETCPTVQDRLTWQAVRQQPDSAGSTGSGCYSCMLKMQPNGVLLRGHVTRCLTLGATDEHRPTVRCRRFCEFGPLGAHSCRQLLNRTLQPRLGWGTCLWPLPTQWDPSFETRDHISNMSCYTSDKEALNTGFQELRVSFRAPLQNQTLQEHFPRHWEGGGCGWGGVIAYLSGPKGRSTILLWTLVK